MGTRAAGADHTATSSISPRWFWGVFLAVFGIWFLVGWKFRNTYALQSPSGFVSAIADDVYITADFGRTLVHGGGPLWYPGAPRVEGCSSPLWMVVVGLLHLVPGFEPDLLGRYVTAVSALLGMGVLYASLSALRMAAERASSASRTALFTLGAFFLAVASLGFLYCSAGGFETTLLGALVVSAHVAAHGEGAAFRPILVAVLSAVAVWVRLDAALYLVGASLVSWSRAKRRELPMLMLAPVLSLTVQFLARRLYFGDFLPNTYYLKATGWPPQHRIPQGCMQNSAALIALVVGVGPLLGFVTRVREGGWARVLSPLSAFVLSLAYSTNLGGDLVFEAFGYDRFTSIGALFLVVALVEYLANAELGSVMRRVSLLATCAIVVFPVVTRPYFDRRIHLRDMGPVRELLRLDTPLGTYDELGRAWIRAGKGLAGATSPGARIAVCAAGSVIYFSGRGGVDLLGKLDRRVARLPVSLVKPPEARCWRGYPGAGHNKEDVRGSFRLERPDVSIVEPPRAERSAYAVAQFGGITFWARRDSRFVRWDRVKVQ